MGRLSTVDDARVFAAVARQMSSAGATTLHALVAETGVSVGSLYHRYGSREGLLARAWLDAVRAFQGRVLAELESGSADAGERAALATPRFCRAEPDRAALLACCRRSEFIGADTPAELRAEIEGVNVAAAAAVARFAKANGHSLDAVRMALVAIPLGAVRLYLPDKTVPRAVDDYVRVAYRAVIRADHARKP
jgi:AcrR family transcriptional regulator